MSFDALEGPLDIVLLSSLDETANCQTKQKPGNHPNFEKEKKRSPSEKAILGATLGIPEHSWSNSRNGTHDLIFVKALLSTLLFQPQTLPSS